MSLYNLQTKSQITSLDFVLNRFSMKLFGTDNIEVITECQTYFSFKLPSTLLGERAKKLKDDYELQGRGAGLITVLCYIRYMCLYAN